MEHKSVEYRECPGKMIRFKYVHFVDNQCKFFSLLSRISTRLKKNMMSQIYNYDL